MGPLEDAARAHLQYTRREWILQAHQIWFRGAWRRFSSSLAAGAGTWVHVAVVFSEQGIAAEPLVNKVMSLDWDEKGRLWVAESPEYPNGLRKANTAEWKESGAVRPGEHEREPLDRISILTDADGDGVMDAKKVFADKLELVTGFVLHRNGVIASAAPAARTASRRVMPRMLPSSIRSCASPCAALAMSRMPTAPATAYATPICAIPMASISARPLTSRR